ncbi:hypothetical protein T484DRAFT_1784622, partial [Baffinella frigidus]
ERSRALAEAGARLETAEIQASVLSEKVAVLSDSNETLLSRLSEAQAVGDLAAAGLANTSRELDAMRACKDQ